MNVSAKDTSCGKETSIVISNDKNRLSPEDIEKSIREAEEMKGTDDLIRKKIEAKNSLENYTYNIKNALNDEKIKDKFTSEDKEKINKIVEETVKWMEANFEA